MRPLKTMWKITDMPISMPPKVDSTTVKGILGDQVCLFCFVLLHKNRFGEARK